MTVVIPLYNKGKYIERAIRSVLGQSRPPDEIIVVDDGSIDDGPQRVAKVNDPRIRLVQQPNRGPGSARNRGIQLATSPLIAFLDADDEWLPGFLEYALALHARFGDELASATVAYIEEPGNRSSVPMWTRRALRNGIHRLHPDLPASELIHRLAFLSPCTTVTRTSVLRELGGFYDKARCVYGEDSYLYLKLLLTRSVAFGLVPLVRYHRDASDLTSGCRGHRPIEPLLTDEGPIIDCCPPPLLPLLRETLYLRASKTACLLAAWGRRHEARELLRRHPRPRRRQPAPLSLAAKVLCSRAGTILAPAARVLARSITRYRPPRLSPTILTTT